MKSDSPDFVYPTAEAEIDEFVVCEAASDAAWGELQQVEPVGAVTLALPPALLARAARLAVLHREMNIDAWLVTVIRERVELEEAALAQAKRAFLESSKRRAG